mgnify:FL=1
MNVFVGLGRLVYEPELKHTQNDIPYFNNKIAIGRPYKRGEEKEQTDYIRISAWRNTAEFICRNFKKGQPIAIEGSLRISSYTDSEGIKREQAEINIETVDFAGSAPAAKSKEGSIPEHGSHEQNMEGFQEVLGDDDLPF